MDRQLYKRIGRLIKETRESLGLSQGELSERMGYSSPATISHFESGQRKLSVADLQQLSSILGIPMEKFFEEKNIQLGMNLFRLRAKKVNPSAREAVASFLAFAQKHGQEAPRVPSGTRVPRPGAAATRILEFAQIKEAPVSLSRVANKLRLPVFNWGFPDEISGIFVFNPACIGVNDNHPYVRQRFTIAHELGHLIYHDGQDLFVDFVDTDLVDFTLDTTERKLETKANQFAADLLMPISWIRRDYNKHGEDELVYLAQKYKVSEQALWFRLINLGLVKESQEESVAIGAPSGDPSD